MCCYCTLITPSLEAIMELTWVNVLLSLKEKFSMAAKHLGLPWNVILSSLSGETQPARWHNPKCHFARRSRRRTHFPFWNDFQVASQTPPARPKQGWQHHCTLSFHYFTTHLSKHRAAYIRSKDLITVPAQKPAFTFEILKILRCISLHQHYVHNWRFHVIIEWGGRWSRSPE